MAKFQRRVTLSPYRLNNTFRLGDGAGTANPLSDADVGKFLKLKGDSLMGLCAVGDEIEAVCETVGDPIALQDGYVLGGVRDDGEVEVTLDGLQATPGTGTCAVGDYVVAGTPVARGTAQGSTPPKVCKATAAATGIVYTWRITALRGTGAVGQIALIERV